MMRTPPHTLYTNDVTAEYLANVDRPVFDEIINTPQSYFILVARAGVAWNEDFLPDAGA